MHSPNPKRKDRYRKTTRQVKSTNLWITTRVDMYFSDLMSFPKDVRVEQDLHYEKEVIYANAYFVKSTNLAIFFCVRPVYLGIITEGIVTPLMNEQLFVINPMGIPETLSTLQSLWPQSDTLLPSYIGLVMLGFDSPFYFPEMALMWTK